MLTDLGMFLIILIIVWKKIDLMKYLGRPKELIILVSLPTSVTRLGDLLHFGQLFIACGNN